MLKCAHNNIKASFIQATSVSILANLASYCYWISTILTNGPSVDKVIKVEDGVGWGKGSFEC